MRRVIGWLSKTRTREKSASLRRRINLGDAQPGYPFYAIGDVHGCLDALKNAEERIAADMATTSNAGPVILLGDYVDRGPASAQVIEHLIRPSDLGLRRLPLCGNHDEMFLNYLNEPAGSREWLSLGGEKTLMSYGIDVHSPAFRSRAKTNDLKRLLEERVPASHRDFLEALPVCLKVGNMLFVHAGIRPGIPLEQQQQQDLLWIREPFLTSGPQLPSLFVIHGHTPSTEPSLGPQRISIDTGAFYTGRLAVLRISGQETRFI